MDLVAEIGYEQYKGIAKFQNRKLENEEQLGIMFEDLRNTSNDHWAPTSSDLPEANETHHEEDNDKEADCDEDNPSDAEDGTPTSGKATKRHHVAEKDKVKKPKSAGGHWMQEQMARIVELNEKTTASCESIVLARMEESTVCSINIVMDLVKARGVVCGTKLHFIATQIFTKKAEKEMFMTLDTPEERFEWLSMKHEWMMRHKD
ncbi:hypothetical protein BAE44_0010292 [Dichanthelium oligosanthes]|uniref:Uncharacterized protein n=1 Tax=Dichanthelium oligosanthes TaxID=888268 RepID=A0A1E5VU93_9POAL|nr:hypothetical protein BAE44_0010292 [Dichanthelium oligosanthes]